METSDKAEIAQVCPFCKSDPEALADAHDEGWRAGREEGRREVWMTGWQAAMDWLAEHKGFEGIALAEEMAARLPSTSPATPDGGA